VYQETGYASWVFLTTWNGASADDTRFGAGVGELKLLFKGDLQIDFRKYLYYFSYQHCDAFG